MRKHRVLAGFLAAVMLLGTMPAALAASVTTDDGIQLNKTAGSLNSNWETEITLSVTAPAAATDGPVAVEFVLDGTYSMFKADKDSKAEENGILLIQEWGNAIKEKFKDKDVYVGVTMFGSEAYTLHTISKLTADSNVELDSTEAILWLWNHEGTNVQAGIRSGMAELNSLGNKVAPANRYLVLVTDGGSFWRMDGRSAVNDVMKDGTHLQNNDAAELDISGKQLKSGGSFAALTGVDTALHTYNSDTLAGVLQEIQNGQLYTNFEKGVYAAAEAVDEIENAKLIAIGYPYYKNTNGLEQLTKLAQGFIDYAGSRTYSAGLYDVYAQDKITEVSATTPEIVAKITNWIATQIGLNNSSTVATIGAGSTITDVIGNGTDNLKNSYNFNLVTTKAITLTINGETYVGKNSGDTWTFGDGSELKYTAGTGTNEEFFLTLGQAINPGTTMTLTYTAKLMDPSNDTGKHTVYPNVQAYLKPVGPDGTTTGKHDFPNPELSYTVGGSEGSSVLNTDDHYSYIIGYKDGYLRPYGTITRGEVATIFFRLLTDEARDKYWCQTNNYSDCNSDLWCNNAISTLSNMGIIDGFTDGTFRPYGKITRAQFAKIAVGFFETTRMEYQGYYTDVPENAWFTDYVEAASRVGLIQGFQDGTFRPNTNITRAQACVIVNRALNRKPDEDHLLPEKQMIVWPDNNPGDWYYADMQEATNSHDYTWLTLRGEPKAMEKWTEKLPQRDWAAFEHAWSTAHSAPGGEVVK